MGSRFHIAVVAALCIFQRAVGSDVSVTQSTEYSSGAMGLGPYQTYESSSFTPAEWNFVLPINSTTAPELSPGLIFFAPRGVDVNQGGALIFDQNGHLVWDGSEYGQTLAFEAQLYRGQPVINLWTGEFNANGYGSGFHLLLNSSYDVIANITTELNGTLADFHEFRITTNNTAIMTAYMELPYDLSSFGIEDGYILSGYVQERDIATGNVLFTWSSLDHVNITESYATPGNVTSDAPWDFFHINSIDKDNAGNYLVSSRHCHTVYYINGTSGNVLWRLGGMISSFAMGNGTNFEWQHDARWRANQTQISIFDNAATDWEIDEVSARGLLLNVDRTAMTAELAVEYLPWNMTVSESQGSVQLQENGNVIVGWGQTPYISEYDAAGQILWATQIGVGDVEAYRAYRLNWTGYPSTLPSVTVVNGTSTTPPSVYVSWNGATEVLTWRLFGSNDGQTITALGDSIRSGFETQLNVSSSASNYTYYQVAGMDATGSYLGFSNFVGTSAASVPPAATETSMVKPIPTGTTATGTSTTTSSAAATSTSKSGALSTSRFDLNLAFVAALTVILATLSFV